MLIPTVHLCTDRFLFTLHPDVLLTLSNGVREETKAIWEGRVLALGRTRSECHLLSLDFVLICLRSISLSNLLILVFPSSHNKTKFLHRIMYLWFNTRSLLPIKAVLVGFIFDVMLDLISVLFLITPALAGKDGLVVQACGSFGQMRQRFQGSTMFFCFFSPCWPWWATSDFYLTWCKYDK